MTRIRLFCIVLALTASAAIAKAQDADDKLIGPVSDPSVELMAHCHCAWRYGALGLWTMRGYEPLRSRAAHAAEMRGIGQHGFMVVVPLGR